jgi:hypothetical protein
MNKPSQNRLPSQNGRIGANANPLINIGLGACGRIGRFLATLGLTCVRALRACACAHTNISSQSSQCSQIVVQAFGLAKLFSSGRILSRIFCLPNRPTERLWRNSVEKPVDRRWTLRGMRGAANAWGNSPRVEI